MGLGLAIKCENENLDWEVMTLDFSEIEKATARDSEADVINTANQLKAQMIGDPRLDA
jgi:hypothetical protein